MKKYIKYVKVALIATFIFLSFFLIIPCHKPSISNATVYELESVYGIGDKLAIQIHDYVTKHDIERVIELKNKIKYLGEKRLEELEDIYR